MKKKYECPTFKQKYLALIFQQGGKLMNMCYTLQEKNEVENLMKLFYDFPFYVEYIAVEQIKNVGDMLSITNKEELGRTDLTDEYVDCSVVNNLRNEDREHTIRIDKDMIKDEFGVTIPFDMEMFSEWKDMLECKECDGQGFNEVGPMCDSPASDCCGGCYEKFECTFCNGVGVINSNL